MYTDPIADLLTRLRNAIQAHKDYVNLPHSNLKENLVKILKDKRIIEDFEISTENKHKEINITLKEMGDYSNFRRVSKPGQRIYIKKDEVKAVRNGLGISIISTSKGLMTNSDAKKANLGGEIICEIY